MGETIMPDPLRSLDLVHPIFQAPIGGIASAELAAAVSDAGGLGHLACTWRSPDQLKALFATMDRLTRKPYGANFVLDFPIEDRLDVALACGVRAISFFWGDAARYVARVKAAGGIADHRGVAAAMALGASGVWVGTRFLAASEANIHPQYQELVLASDGDNTLYSELFDIGWPRAPLRSLKNATTRNWEAAGRP